MKALLKSFYLFLRQIWDDSMLIAVVFLPLLIGFIFRYAVPLLDRAVLAVYFGSPVLADYYLIFDLFLALITPYFFCFVSALVMLGEHDENLSAYLAVTPIGTRGYIVSRLVFPVVLSLPASLLLLGFFALSAWNYGISFLVCLSGSLMCLPIALIIFSFSQNRVEGMALGKMANLYTLGSFVPFFLRSPMQYAFSFLPSFWIAKMALHRQAIYVLPALLATLVWTFFLYRRFSRKLQSS